MTVEVSHVSTSTPLEFHTSVINRVAVSPCHNLFPVLYADTG
jgi:hypothetical protein